MKQKLEFYIYSVGLKVLKIRLNNLGRCIIIRWWRESLHHHHHHYFKDTRFCFQQTMQSQSIQACKISV